MADSGDNRAILWPIWAGPNRPGPKVVVKPGIWVPRGLANPYMRILIWGKWTGLDVARGTSERPTGGSWGDSVRRPSDRSKRDPYN